MRKFLIAGLMLVGQLAFGQPTPEQTIKDALPKVVLVEVHGMVDDYASDESTYTVKVPVSWFGSGAFISPDGMILTCDHLFIRKLEDRSIIVKMSNGKKYRALLLSENEKKDLGLLKVFPMHPLPYFEVGKPVVRGQKVFAFGAPLLLEKTVSTGFVENVSIKYDKEPRTLHSAGLNPGNSGGPLISEDGKLVGVNIAHLMSNIFMRAEGLGLAVELKDVQKFLKD